MGMMDAIAAISQFRTKTINVAEQSIEKQVGTDGTAVFNSLGNRHYDTQDDVNKDELEAIKGEILAYQQREQAKLEQLRTEVTNKAKGEYDKEKHGDDFDSYLQECLNNTPALNAQIEVPPSLQTRLEIAESKQRDLLARVCEQRNGINTADVVNEDLAEKMDTTINYAA